MHMSHFTSIHLCIYSSSSECVPGRKWWCEINALQSLKAGTKTPGDLLSLVSCIWIVTNNLQFPEYHVFTQTGYVQTNTIWIRSLNCSFIKTASLQILCLPTALFYISSMTMDDWLQWLPCFVQDAPTICIIVLPWKKVYHQVGAIWAMVFKLPYSSWNGFCNLFI